MNRPIDRERLIRIAQAARWFEERTGKRPSVAAIYRWVGRGIKGRRLETVRAGRDLFTSVEACSRFMHGDDPQAVAVVTVQADEPVHVESDAITADVAALEGRVFKRGRKVAT
jgi:hypothetical protein